MIVAGLDEVGWGACAGPIVSVVAVFRDEDIALMPPGVRDSKKVTAKKRDMLYQPLVQLAMDVGIGHAWAWEVDTLSPFEALHLSYRRAIGELITNPDRLIVDGSNRVQGCALDQVVEPKADDRYWQVSAASIIAKVFRDRVMTEYSRVYPQYGFDRHFGYGTEEHRTAIKKHGLLIDSNDLSKYVHRQRYCHGFV